MSTATDRQRLYQEAAALYAYSQLKPTPATDIHDGVVSALRILQTASGIQPYFALEPHHIAFKSTVSDKASWLSNRLTYFLRVAALGHPQFMVMENDNPIWSPTKAREVAEILITEELGLDTVAKTELLTYATQQAWQAEETVIDRFAHQNSILVDNLWSLIPENKNKEKDFDAPLTQREALAIGQGIVLAMHETTGWVATHTEELIRAGNNDKAKELSEFRRGHARFIARLGAQGLPTQEIPRGHLDHVGLLLTNYFSDNPQNSPELVEAIFTRGGPELLPTGPQLHDRRNIATWATDTSKALGITPPRPR